MDFAQGNNGVTGWAVIAHRGAAEMILWGPFDSEEAAEEFISEEGHLPEIVGRYEEPYPAGLSVFTHPIYDPETHLQYRKEWDE